MIDVSIDPNLTLGPLSTTWSSFLTLLALVFGTVTWAWLTRAEWLERYGEGQGDAHLYAVATASITAGLVGARLFHVVDFWPVYAGDLVRVLDISTGRAVMGAIVGGAIGALAALRVRGLPAGAALDRAALALPFAMAIGRVGDVISGERWSAACSGLPWCVRYTAPLTAGQSTYVHPVAGYELLADLLIGAVLVVLARRRGIRGDAALLYAFLVLYGAVRFADSFFRLDAPSWGPLVLAQWFAIAFVLIGVAGLAIPRTAEGRSVRRS